MKLKQEHFAKLALKILSFLMQKKSLTMKMDEAAIKSTITTIFVQDALKIENITKKAQTVMEQHKAKVQTGEIDYQKMFPMIKKELFKKEGLPLSETNYSEDHIKKLSLKIHDKLYLDNMVDYHDDEQSLMDIQHVMGEFFAIREKAVATARQKVSSLSKNVAPGSNQWNVLFDKYLTEELKKWGFH